VVTRPGRWLLLLALLLAFPLAACAAAVASTAPASAPPAVVPTPEPLPTVRMAFTERYGGNATLWLTYATGLFRRHGVEVTLMQASDRAGFGALAAGEVDAVVGSGAPALAAAAAGTHLQFIAGLVNQLPHRLMLAGGADAPTEWRGLRLGTGRPGSPADLALRVALSELGVDPDQDVTLIQIGSVSERQAALENGVIQGAAVVPPEATLLARRGFYTAVDLAQTSREFANSQLVVRAQLARERPAVVQQVVDALVEGAALAKRDRALTKRVLAEYLEIADEQALDETYTFFVQQLAPRVPYPATAGLRRLQALLADGDPAIAALDPTALVDARFVRRALDSGLVSRVGIVP
jgi:NitT/TauT family transport system substrate-binding protein